MASLLASPPLRSRGVATWRARTSGALPERRPPPRRTRRYLPLALLTTALVIVLPAALVSAVVPRGGPLLIVASGLAAVALSTAIAAAGAAIWKRQPGSRDVVFSDLLLWGWLRRCWAERRLSQARDLFDSARKSGPDVSIELVTGLSRLLEARDAYTHGHGQRVARHATRIARAMHLSPVEIAKIQTAAAVHDVGKLYTPRQILNNPHRLTDAEYEVAKRHSVWGARMLSTVGDEEITAMVRHHHERIDGHGYPDGLAGSAIPLGARIIAVADTFDAITSSRAYRSACTQKKALDVLADEAGTQLDPAAVAAFGRRYGARRSVAGLALVTTAPGRILAALQTASQSLVAGGVASIIPAVGAAGLLTLSPGLTRSTAVRGARGLPSVAHTLVVATHGQARRTTSRPAVSPHHTIHRAFRAPSSSRPASSPPATPHSPNRPTGASTHGPTEGAAPKTPAITPALPTPVPGPPLPPSPPVTVPPVAPPVSIPSVPGVNPPSVQVPSVPGTGVTPPISVAGTTLPAAG
ncbi:MAG TPA: HD-GYP domain-containing protein [Solirubrobacteraceae bacterium]|jgi:HD-GYP domain-containing protein (c-di-GMP phosphodiesterase class II)|nr:HD-GYP domain-containing protein [Solirubrobacteraceae bacterium]